MCKWSREEGAGMEVGAGHFMKEVAEDQHLKKWENFNQKCQGPTSRLTQSVSNT